MTIAVASSSLSRAMRSTAFKKKVVGTFWEYYKNRFHTLTLEKVGSTWEDAVFSHMQYTWRSLVPAMFSMLEIFSLVYSRDLPVQSVHKAAHRAR